MVIEYLFCSSFADIFKGYIQSKVHVELESFTPYLRYVDEISITANSRDKVNGLQKIINSLHINIELNVEHETYEKVKCTNK